MVFGRIVSRRSWSLNSCLPNHSPDWWRLTLFLVICASGLLSTWLHRKAFHAWFNPNERVLRRSIEAEEGQQHQRRLVLLKAVRRIPMTTRLEFKPSTGTVSAQVVLPWPIRFRHTLTSLIRGKTLTRGRREKARYEREQAALRRFLERTSLHD